MSAYSTLNITRSKAKEYIISKIFGSSSDDELGRIMDEFLSDRLYNVWIVNDGEPNDDDYL